MKKQIVKSAYLSDSEECYLSERIYVRQVVSGSGQPISQAPLKALETVFVANHPDYVSQGGEKRSRLDWCDRCDSYQPVDCFLRCDTCKPGSFHDSCNADDY